MRLRQLSFRASFYNFFPALLATVPFAATLRATTKKPTATLDQLHSFNGPVPTGVTVNIGSGRIFV